MTFLLKVLTQSFILFLEDENIIYSNNQIDNIRINTSDNILVDQYIQLFESRFKLFNSGNRKNENHIVQLSGQEALRYEGINNQINLLKYMISNNLSRNSRCLCDSGSKYKKCHEIEILNAIKTPNIAYDA